MEQATANALRLTERLGIKAPVAMGAAKPLAQDLSTSEGVHGEDGLSGYAGQAPATIHTSESAAEQLANRARREPGELSLLDPGLATYHEDRFAIELTGRYTRGKIVADQRFLAPGSPFGRDIGVSRTTAKYAVTADTATFLDRLKRAVTQP